MPSTMYTTRIAIDQQHPQVAERAFERLGRALEAGADGGRQRLVGDVAESWSTTSPSATPGFRSNEIVDRRQLPVVIDRLRSDVLLQRRQRIQRNQRAGRCP